MLRSIAIQCCYLSKVVNMRVYSALSIEMLMSAAYSCLIGRDIFFYNI